MISRALILFLLGFFSFAHASAEFSCPYPSSIKRKAGHFQSDNGHWRSPAGGADSFLERFVGAVFIPANDQERKQGYLEYCSYKAANNQWVNLRFQAPEPLSGMSLTDSTHWMPARGPFDQEIFVCTDSQPDNCSFTLDRPKY
ncbi:DUF3757 domain-containing protein [Pseudomonas shahriarae]|jgi:hypothetical protein|nr:MULTISPECIES: DUF3757 domain-containing protein [Pseudomonas]MBK3439441.1 DUF3757 domain-containing protein [Pseudomonas sp. MF7448]MCM8562446.1 DUF3757 domain-containing protein [Pseudomonas shahriarae]NMY84928.1 DUF3757 domain-containing protein [Pseudomonas sp. WS 5411]QYM70198.1 DUF3757 domain-containing protein [Pseudomonas sp. So3.2b]